MSMRFVVRLGLVGVTAALLMAVGASVYSDDSPTAASSAQIKRGRYLVTIGGCGDCHSPKVMTAQGPMEDESRLLSGHPADEPVPAMPEGVLGPGKWAAACSGSFTAWVGPWGISFASNLSPDKTTGLGNWTDQQFIDAMRTGKHRGFGRQILPPMPWFNVGKLPDEDIKAILAYFKSLPPIKNKVPDPIPPASH